MLNESSIAMIAFSIPVSVFVFVFILDVSQRRELRQPDLVETEPEELGLSSGLAGMDEVG
jgi:hypothetical protein